MDTLIATAFAALFAGCWIWEMRVLRKVRDGHLLECKRLREEFFVSVRAARNEGWYEGVEYQRNLMTRKRDKAGRFA